MRIKSMFFDRPKVMRAVDRGKRQSLSKAGAFIRRTARRSIRKAPKTGKRTSQPGKPPYSHEGSLRRLIFFGYDPQRDSVVIGPVGFRRSTAPEALEHGGRSVLYRRRRGRLVAERVRVRARPFMKPALDKERPKLAAVWRNSIRPTGGVA